MPLTSNVLPNFSWMTCLTGVFGENVGSGTLAVRSILFADNSLSSLPAIGTIQTVPIPFDCNVVAMGVSYLSSAAEPFVFTSGALQFRLGQLPVGANAEPTSFVPFRASSSLPADTPLIEWGTELNGTHPSTIVSNLNVPLKAGTLLCGQSLEAGVMFSDANAEISCSIWIASNTPVKDLSGLK